MKLLTLSACALVALALSFSAAAAQDAAAPQPASPAPPAPTITFKTVSTLPMPTTIEVDNSVSCRLMDGGQTIFCTAAPRPAPAPTEADPE